jgi:hypothetical protein
MHQVEGDLGGGVNISANLVCTRGASLTDPSVGNIETGLSVLGQEGFSGEGCKWS